LFKKAEGNADIREVEVMPLKKISSIFIILSSLSVFACAQGPNSPMGYGGHMMGYGYGGGLMWLVILVLVGVAVYFLLQFKKSKGSDSATIETSLDMLKKRYASGEIDKEEFDQKKKDLES
jgi:putative membrane protein